MRVLLLALVLLQIGKRGNETNQLPVLHHSEVGAILLATGERGRRESMCKLF